MCDSSLLPTMTHSQTNDSHLQCTQVYRCVGCHGISEEQHLHEVGTVGSQGRLSGGGSVKAVLSEEDLSQFDPGGRGK